ncbi:MAG: reductive dehalogenase [Syntrophomonadaceae bacterium]|nr:reductive dehalogenase [Syntrophomonadaceae bacterium]
MEEKVSKDRTDDSIEAQDGKTMKNKPGINRRDFFKVTGVTATVAGAASMGGIGYLSGASPLTNTGWETAKIGEYFDRGPFEIDKPKYNQVGTPRRPHYMLSRLARVPHFERVNWNDPATIPPDIAAWYRENPKAMEMDRLLIEKVRPERNRVVQEIGNRFIIHGAFFGAYGTTHPPAVNGKPEEFDWRGVRQPAFEIKDPAEMSKLIKEVGKLYGSSLVRIAKFNPIWTYDKSTGTGGGTGAVDPRRGYRFGEDIVAPEWWQYAITLGVPNEWDSSRGNPNFGHSFDAYNEVSIAAARMTSFIKALGYAARPHSPNTGYEVIVPPILVDAGVGEQGRTGFVVTPEFGTNFRPAVITTNLPLKPDKPIDIGVREFCTTCKICAETCPAEAIPFDGPKEIRGRGFDGWQVDIERCHNMWQSIPGTPSCRICLITCPFSRRSNWLHTTARDIAVRDRTGAVHSALTWMEKTFYGQHDPSHYLGPEWGNFRNPPWYFDVERFLNVKKS